MPCILHKSDWALFLDGNGVSMSLLLIRVYPETCTLQLCCVAGTKMSGVPAIFNPACTLTSATSLLVFMYFNDCSA